MEDVEWPKELGKEYFEELQKTRKLQSAYIEMPKYFLSCHWKKMKNETITINETWEKF
jgi:hypothetical protein